MFVNIKYPKGYKMERSSDYQKSQRKAVYARSV